MALKLLGHVWRAADASSELRAERHAAPRTIELREPSRWNPMRPAHAKADERAAPRMSEPVWAETQPWFHD